MLTQVPDAFAIVISRSGYEHDFAELFLVLEPCVRGADFAQRVDAVDHGTELFAEDELQHLSLIHI